jgi:hypothetical protein
MLDQSRDTVLPLPDWLEPTSTDKREAEVSGRPPGISVWDTELTTVAQARQHAGNGGHAFTLGVGALRTTAARFNRPLDVVRNPVPGEGGDGHSLVEGMKRPEGLERRLQKDFLQAVLQLCVLLAD